MVEKNQVSTLSSGNMEETISFSLLAVEVLYVMNLFLELGYKGRLRTVTGMFPAMALGIQVFQFNYAQKRYTNFISLALLMSSMADLALDEGAFEVGMLVHLIARMLYSLGFRMTGSKLKSSQEKLYSLGIGLLLATFASSVMMLLVPHIERKESEYVFYGCIFYLGVEVTLGFNCLARSSVSPISDAYAKIGVIFILLSDLMLTFEKYNPDVNIPKAPAIVAVLYFIGQNALAKSALIPLPKAANNIDTDTQKLSAASASTGSQSSGSSSSKKTKTKKPKRRKQR